MSGCFNRFFIITNALNTWVENKEGTQKAKYLAENMKIKLLQSSQMARFQFQLGSIIRESWVGIGCVYLGVAHQALFLVPCRYHVHKNREPKNSFPLVNLILLIKIFNNNNNNNNNNTPELSCLLLHWAVLFIIVSDI